MASILEEVQIAFEANSPESNIGITKRELKSGSVLLKPGQFQEFGFVVESGCLRSYLLDNGGKEHTIHFAPEGWIITDMEAATKDAAASLYIEAIEPTTVYFVPTRAYEDIMGRDLERLQFTNRMLTNRILALQRRLILQLMADAESRYTEFIKTYPQLANRVPLKNIASYLGITPESLSRVRKQMTTKAG